MINERFYIEYPHFRLPIYWSFILFVTAISFTIQPWALKVLDVPMHVGLTVILYGLLIVLKPNITIRSLRLFTGYQWCLLLIICISIAYSILRGDAQLIRLQQAIIGIMLAIVTAVAMMNPRARKYLFVGLALAAIASSGVAIMQYIGMAGWSWERTAYYGYAEKTASGLEYFPVSYAYSVVAIAIVGFISLWARIRAGIYLKLLPVMLGGLVFLLVIVGLLMSRSRSGILGVFAGVLILAWGGMYLQLKLFTMWQLMTGMFILLLLVLVSDISFISDFQDKAARAGEGDMRLGATWSIFLPALFKYPLGINEEMYNAAALSMDYSDPRLADMKSLLQQTHGHAPHNILLTTGLFFGMPVLIALFLFYASIFTVAFKSMVKIRKTDKLRAYTIVIMLAVNLGLLVHAWFHNSNIFFGEMRGWIWIGALMATVRFYQSEAPVTKKI